MSGTNEGSNGSASSSTDPPEGLRTPSPDSVRAVTMESCSDLTFVHVRVEKYMNLTQVRFQWVKTTETRVAGTTVDALESTSILSPANRGARALTTESLRGMAEKLNMSWRCLRVEIFLTNCFSPPHLSKHSRYRRLGLTSEYLDFVGSLMAMARGSRERSGGS
jgi:hypothetical protein